MGIGFDHVGLSVADLEGAAAFYASAFGFSPQLEFGLAPHPVRGLMMSHESGVRLELFQHERSTAGIRATSPVEAIATRGYGHFALTATDIQDAFQSAIRAGARPMIPPSPSPEPGIRFAFLTDPEGNLVELVERR